MKKKLLIVLAFCVFCCIFAYASRMRQSASEAAWWERFNSLSPEEQACINFRPSRDTGVANEEYPVETEKVDKNEFE